MMGDWGRIVIGGDEIRGLLIVLLETKQSVLLLVVLIDAVLVSFPLKGTTILQFIVFG
jgi:hypothetical protein